MKQKEVFLESEGDACFFRNQESLGVEDDSLFFIVKELVNESNDIRDVLEVGCGPGYRLAKIKQSLGLNVCGVEPSQKAVQYAYQNGVNVLQGTADSLPFEGQFDIFIFGFCLYLCDREDLFRIACEADRAVRKNGWLIIKDFYSPVPCHNKYHHYPGVNSYKMDYRQLFTWHPYYECFYHMVKHYSNQMYTDNSYDWVAVSVLRKKQF